MLIITRNRGLLYFLILWYCLGY